MGALLPFKKIKNYGQRTVAATWTHRSPWSIHIQFALNMKLKAYTDIYGNKSYQN